MEVIEKLGIKCQPHPRPCSVSWLQKWHHMMVTRQRLINFKLGQLEDSVLHDVIIMDYFHLLLGIPWKYIQKMIYGSHSNTIMVWKDIG